MKKTKLLSLLLSTAMLVTLFAGCTTGTTAGTTAGTPAPVVSGAPAAPGDAFNMNVCVAAEPQTIDPALNSAVDGGIMTQHMFEGLTKWADSGKALNATANTAELVNGQAKDYVKTVNADGTVTYTFTLRDDIKWSDGKPVTAKDFEFAWRRLVTPATAADYCNMLSMVANYDNVLTGKPALDANGKEQYIDKDKNPTTKDAEGAVLLKSYDDPSTFGVAAPDDKTFVVTLSYDCPYFLEICAFPACLPVREDMITKYGDKWTFTPESYISNGAYKMSEWVHNASITMVKNDQYYDVANLGPDSITFKLMDDQNAMLTAFRSGELQFINDMPVDEIAGLVASGELNIVDYLGTYYVCYQTQKAPFDDWRVRKAFTLAIDSKYIVDNVTQTGQIPADAFVSPGVSDAAEGSDFHTTGGAFWTAPTDTAQYEKNVAEAKQLLADAGFPDGAGFPVVTYLYNTSDNHKAIGEALQSQWQKALNVTVKIENQDWSVFLETRKQGDYQIARNGWISDYNDPMAYLDMWITGGGNNDAQYSNPDYDAAIKKALATSDPSERMKYMHEAEDIIIGKDWALGPIYFYTNKYMMNEKVTGMTYTPLGWFNFTHCVQA